ncbi:hypothetical protein [Streptomyces sp. NPDC101249]|uniref:hypothetical protein n=1 Tax=Streptomyces sp. NPDC101249 TaxID=3366140 RepID=UPI0037F1EE2A
MTPADEITTAARTLRTLATTAADDSGDTHWTSHRITTRDARLRADGDDILRGGSTGPHGRGSRPHFHPPVADYIAAMSPIVGLALADWLNSWTGIDLREDAALPADAQHALAVARQINRSQP